MDRTGTLCLLLMCENQSGRPPSRAHAYVSLEADAILPNVTAIETKSRPDTMAVAASTDPVACVQISIIGNAAFTAASRSPRQNNNTRMIAHARTPFKATVQNIARGTACRAFRTSSDMCTAPSKPGSMIRHWRRTLAPAVLMQVRYALAAYGGVYAQATVPPKDQTSM
jgi:hypothetical protein